MHVRQGCAGVSGQPSRKRHSEGRVHCAPPVCMCRFHQQQRTPRPHVHPSCPRPAGVAGAVSRSATAPIDRLKMLLQIHDCEKGMTIKEGIRKMSAEGAARPGLVLLLVPGCNCVDAGLMLGWCWVGLGSCCGGRGICPVAHALFWLLLPAWTANHCEQAACALSSRAMAPTWSR